MATQESEATKAAASNGEVKWMSLPFVLHVSVRELGSCVFFLAPSVLSLNIWTCWRAFSPEPDDVVSAGWFKTTPPPAFNDVLGNLHC